MPIQVVSWKCSICGKIFDNKEKHCRDCEEGHPQIDHVSAVFTPGQKNPSSLRAYYTNGQMQEFYEAARTKL